MTNRNQQRLGAPQHIPQQPQIMPPSQSQMYNAPTEFVELPSRGLLYPEGHPLFGKAELEIKFMTTKEEDILNNKSLLRENEAVNRMIQSIIVDPQVSVFDLLPTDRNAIMVAARRSGYGEEYKTTIRCHACEQLFDNTFNLGETRQIIEPSQDAPVVIDSGLINMQLPKSGLNVQIKILTVSDERDLSYSAKVKEKNNLPDSSITDLLTTMIVSVNGNTDRAYIASVVAGLPILDSRHIRNTYDSCTPQLDLSHDVECPHCGTAGRRNMPFTADFFWPQ